MNLRKLKPVTLLGLTYWLGLGFIGALSAQGSTQVYSWGRNPQSSVPTDFSGDVVAIAAGNINGGSMALTENGKPINWGVLSNVLSPPTLSNIAFVSLSTGSFSSDALYIKTNGSVLILGDNFNFEMSPPAGLTNVVALGAGYRHVAALKSDGTVVCWGGPYGSAPLLVPSGLSRVVAISVTDDHTLALRSDGTVVAWGSTLTARSPSLTNIIAISAGVSSNLFLRNDGRVLAQSSSGTALVDSPPNLSNIVAISAGNAHFMAIKADGTVVCWGKNERGQSDVPADLTNAAAIAAGYKYSLALAGSVPPRLPASPVNFSVVYGSRVLLPALATGTQPLYYQWRCNGTNLVGETNLFLSRTNFQKEQAGIYSVTVSNLFGVVTRDRFELKLVGLVITNQPQSQTVNGGTNFTFSVGVEGTSLAYQWRFNGTNLDGATNAQLTLTNVQPNQAGNYAVVVSNPVATVNSSVATLTVIPLSLTLQPAQWTVYGGGSFGFRAVAPGVAPITFEWRFNGVVIPGETNDLLFRTNAQMNQAGNYSVAVSNPYTNFTSPDSVVTVVPLVITTPPRDVSTFRGGTAVFSNVVAGLPPFSWQWQRNGTNLPGATNQTLVLTNVQFEQAGAYSVTASNQYTTVTSTNANLFVGWVATWGDNTYDQCVVPPGLSNVSSLGAGAAFSMALRADGSVATWGDSRRGQSQIPDRATNVIAIAAGAEFGMALRADGKLAVWGYNDKEQTTVPTDLNDIVAIAGGGSHAMALNSDGIVRIWGDNFSGQTIPPLGATNLVAISAGDQHCLGLRADGSVVAWGGNAYHQTNVPTDLTNVVAITAKYYSSAALTADGRLLVWGANSIDQSALPTGLTNINAFAMGSDHIVLLQSDGSLRTVGPNYMQTNLAAGLTKAASIACGNGFSMALLGDGPPVTQAFATNTLVGTNGFSLAIPTQCGRVYRLEYVTSPDATNWTALPLVAGNGGLRTLADPSATNSSPRFYRVRRW